MLEVLILVSKCAIAVETYPKIFPAVTAAKINGCNVSKGESLRDFSLLITSRDSLLFVIIHTRKQDLASEDRNICF